MLRNPHILYQRSCWCSGVNNRTVVEEMVASREQEGGLMAKGAIQFRLADFALLKRPVLRQSITGIQPGIAEQGQEVAPVTTVHAASGGDFQAPLTGAAEFGGIRILVYRHVFHPRGRQIERAGLHAIHNDGRSASADNGRLEKQRRDG